MPPLPTLGGEGIMFPGRPSVVRPAVHCPLTSISCGLTC